GTIDSLVELFQGRLAKAVMDRVCREGDGLFPSPSEIKVSCSCPDRADMCKHVAAALYGIGARLDEKPQLLFVLRGVDENELIANAGTDLPLSKATPHAVKVLDHGDVGALFGLEMAETAHFDTSAAPERSKRTKVTKAGKAHAELKPTAANEPIYKTLVANQNKPSRTSPRREPKRVGPVQARKRRSQRRRDRGASASQ